MGLSFVYPDRAVWRLQHPRVQSSKQGSGEAGLGHPPLQPLAKEPQQRPECGAGAAPGVWPSPVQFLK